MRLVKLTFSDDDSVIYINPELVRYVWPREDHTRLYFGDNEYLSVHDKGEYVVESLKDIV